VRVMCLIGDFEVCYCEDLVWMLCVVRFVVKLGFDIDLSVVESIFWLVLLLVLVLWCVRICCCVLRVDRIVCVECGFVWWCSVCVLCCAPVVVVLGSSVGSRFSCSSLWKLRLLWLDRNILSDSLNSCAGVVPVSSGASWGIGSVVLGLMLKFSFVVRCVVRSICIGFLW
jgi:tRNA nucleotidyltransferase/poly(A) polymerase